MAIYTLSVTHDIDLGDSAAQDAFRSAILACIANDLDFVDARVAIRIRRDGTVTINHLEGTLSTDGTDIQVVAATRTQVTLRDIQASNAFLRIGDVKFRVAANDTEWQPQQGDTVLWDGFVHEVLGVDIKVMGTTYLLWCRRV